MEQGKRLDGVYHFQAQCKDIVHTVSIPILFSFRVVEQEDGTFIADRFSPAGIAEVLKDKELLLVKSILQDGRTELIIGEIKQKVEKGYLVDISKGEKIVESRAFDRFSFCPEFLGKFNVLSPEGKELGNCYILDISLGGIKGFSKTLLHEDVREGNILVIQQGSQKLEVEVVRTKMTEHEVTFGAKIVKANFDIMKYIIRNYTRFVKELLTEAKAG
jgi:hypothetical protein